MTKQEFDLTKRIFEVIVDLKILDPKDSKKGNYILINTK